MARKVVKRSASQPGDDPRGFIDHLLGKSPARARAERDLNELAERQLPDAQRTLKDHQANCDACVRALPCRKSDALLKEVQTLHLAIIHLRSALSRRD
jgi:hypothetical protein